MNDTLFFFASTRDERCRMVKDKHLDGYYTLQYIDSGGVWLAYDDREHILEGPWFFPAFPGPRLRFQAAPGFSSWFHRHVGFQGPLVNRWIADGLWSFAPQRPPVGDDYAVRFDALIALSLQTDRWGRLRAINALEALLIEMAGARAQEAKNVDWMTQVIDRLSQSTVFAPDCEQIAREYGVGQSALRRRFKEATGMSPYQFVLESRLIRARAMLRETDLPLKQIADRLGYESVHYFTRQFRSAAGLPPGEYRKRLRL
ncbi:MAG: AraC family transcriptional regulator [Capsulimonas sp.]|uniref:helix-turn-helix domain-containing protein n=1 Tax=Capsulimonas sp. TaxID=2494211 RepID=UPI003265E6F8